MRRQESATKNKAPHRARHKIKINLKRLPILSLIILLLFLQFLKIQFFPRASKQFLNSAQAVENVPNEKMCCSLGGQETEMICVETILHYFFNRLS